MEYKWCKVLILAGICWILPTEALAQSNSNSETIRYPENYAQYYTQRLYFSPTVDIPPGLIADISAGGWALYLINCCFTVSPVLSAGIAPLDSMLYIEVGTRQIFEEGRKGYKFPVDVGIRGNVFRSRAIQVGFGYQYHDIYYHSSDADLPPYYSQHWIYGGVVYSRTKKMYTLNIGPRILDDKIVGIALSVGAVFRLSESLSIIADFYTYGHEFGGGFWTGLRFHGKYMKIDIATELGLGLFVSFGVPFY